MTQQFDITYRVRGGRPQSPPDRGYPDGMYVDLSDGAQTCCVAELPYPNPNPNIGTWLIQCHHCGLHVAVTAASRPDDPRTVRLACSQKVTP